MDWHHELLARLNLGSSGKIAELVDECSGITLGARALAIPHRVSPGCTTTLTDSRAGLRGGRRAGLSYERHHTEHETGHDGQRCSRRRRYVRLIGNRQGTRRPGCNFGGCLITCRHDRQHRTLASGQAGIVDGARAEGGLRGGAKAAVMGVSLFRV